MSNNSKETCAICLSYTNIKYHKCPGPGTFDFKANATKAFVGDARHRLDVVQLLVHHNYDQSCSHTLLQDFVSGESQTAYLKSSKYYQDSYSKLSKHKTSTIFEYYYETDMIFRFNYIIYVYMVLKHSVLVKDLD